MKIKPVINSVKPKYPDKYEIELNKALLYYRPKSWLKNPIIGLAVTALATVGLSGLAGCNNFGVIAGDMASPAINHISDSDALDIIAEELRKAGYDLTAGVDAGNGGFKFDAQITDGVNENNIDLEYVSMEDYEDKKYPGLTYSDYGHPKKIAEQLKGAYNAAAVFYDPEREYPGSDEEIRAQALDFIEWLKSVGAEG